MTILLFGFDWFETFHWTGMEDLYGRKLWWMELYRWSGVVLGEKIGGGRNLDL